MITKWLLHDYYTAVSRVTMLVLGAVVLSVVVAVVYQMVSARLLGWVIGGRIASIWPEKVFDFVLSLWIKGFWRFLGGKLQQVQHCLILDTKNMINTLIDFLLQLWHHLMLLRPTNVIIFVLVLLDFGFFLLLFHAVLSLLGISVCFNWSLFCSKLWVIHQFIYILLYIKYTCITLNITSDCVDPEFGELLYGFNTRSFSH